MAVDRGRRGNARPAYRVFLRLASLAFSRFGDTLWHILTEGARVDETEPQEPWLWYEVEAPYCRECDDYHWGLCEAL